MEWASSIFQVLFKLGLPVGVISFLMVRWLLRSGVVTERDGIKALSKEIDGLAKARKKQRKSDQENPEKLHFLQEKWLKFGGGFYGIVALYTYGLVEFNEIRDTITTFGGFSAFFDALGLSLLINMLIEGLRNFITAIAWPAYWIPEFGGRNSWVLFVVAYGAYWVGTKVAQHFNEDKSDSEV